MSKLTIVVTAIGALLVVMAAEGHLEGSHESAPNADYIFDQQALRVYSLEIAADDWEWLNDNPLLEEYVPASLDFEGERYPEVAVRYKGAYGTLHPCFDAEGRRFDAEGHLVCSKLSLKIKFSEYDQEGRFYGLKRLNFNSMISDGSKLHDRLAHGLFNDFGVIAPRAVHARVEVNGESLGLFVLVEAVDGRFTRSRFPNDGEGNLYKEVWPVYFEDSPYRAALRTNRNEDPSFEKMRRFAHALAEAGSEGIPDVVDEWMDAAMLARYLAVDRAVENWDGIMGWWCSGGSCTNHNYYWYEEQHSDRMWLIPSDLDHTFHVPNWFAESGLAAWDDASLGCEPVAISTHFVRRAAACDAFVRALGNEMRSAYAAATRELLADLFTPAELHRRIDTFEAQIAAEIEADPTVRNKRQWRRDVETLRTKVIALHHRLATEFKPRSGVLRAGLGR